MRFVVPLATLLAACGGDADDDTTDTDTETDTDTDADADSDADADTDTDSDTDSDADTDTGPAYSGFLTRIGAATVNAGYAGTEEIRVVGDDGYGAVVCSITMDLTSVAPRGDCPVCEWAFDLEVSNATVVVDDLGACMGAVGIDATNVATLNGTIRSYGYNPDYFGHSQVLVFDDGGGWATVSYATWDEAARTFDYVWDDGITPY